MATSTQKVSPSTRPLDMIFAEMALRHEKVSREIIQKGWAVMKEMGAFGIQRSLSSLLVERKLIDRAVEKEVLQEVGRIKISCARCNKGLFLRELDKDGRLRCGRCEDLLGLTVKKATEAGDGRSAPIEQRVGSVLLQSSSGPGDRKSAPGSPARAPKAKIDRGHQYLGAPDPSTADEKVRKEAPEDIIAMPVRISARKAIKKFQIETVLHGGPYGRLYRARAGATGKKQAPVALKVFDAEDSAQPESFEDLKQSLKSWNAHGGGKANPPHHLMREESLRYLVRPYLRAPHVALADLPLPEADDRERVLWYVASSVGSLHQAGLVHGNLKPSNIFIKKKEKIENAFLVDPALHHLLPEEDPLSRWHTLTKGPRYRSPEEVAGERPTAASDVYSLGWIYYAVLAGSPPFVGIPAPEILRRHREGPCPELPPEQGKWNDLVKQMTAVAPAERPRNGLEVQKLVEAIRVGKKPRFSPPTPRTTPSERDEFSARTKNRRFLWRYAVGPVALVVALVWVGWCFFEWGRSRAVQTSQERPGELHRRLAEDAFRRTRAEARASDRNCRDLWDRYLATFPDTPLSAHAEAEKHNCPAAVPEELLPR